LIGLEGYEGLVQGMIFWVQKACEHLLDPGNVKSLRLDMHVTMVEHSVFGHVLRMYVSGMPCSLLELMS
jgi:hypothetical protein